jgi:hypothetical protein
MDQEGQLFTEKLMHTNWGRNQQLVQRVVSTLYGQ